MFFNLQFCFIFLNAWTYKQAYQLIYHKYTYFHTYASKKKKHPGGLLIIHPLICICTITIQVLMFSCRSFSDLRGQFSWCYHSFISISVTCFYLLLFVILSLYIMAILVLTDLNSLNSTQSPIFYEVVRYGVWEAPTVRPTETLIIQEGFPIILIYSFDSFYFIR